MGVWNAAINGWNDKFRWANVCDRSKQSLTWAIPLIGLISLEHQFLARELQKLTVMVRLQVILETLNHNLVDCLELNFLSSMGKMYKGGWIRVITSLRLFCLANAYCLAKLQVDTLNDTKNKSKPIHLNNNVVEVRESLKKEKLGINVFTVAKVYTRSQM